MPSRGMVTPCIVIIRENLDTRCIVNRNDIAEQIFLKEEVEKNSVCQIRRAILHADRAACFVVQVNQRIVAPSFADDLRAIQSVDVLYVIDGFACADAGIVVLIDNGCTAFGRCCQLAAVLPRQGCRGQTGIIGCWVTNSIILVIPEADTALQTVTVVGVRKGQNGIRTDCAFGRISVNLFACTVAQFVQGTVSACPPRLRHRSGGGD